MDGQCSGDLVLIVDDNLKNIQVLGAVLRRRSRSTWPRTGCRRFI